MEDEEAKQEDELNVFRAFLISLTRFSGVQDKKSRWKLLLGKGGLLRKGIYNGIHGVVRICKSCKCEMEKIIEMVKELEVLRLKGAWQVERFCEDLSNRKAMEGRKDRFDRRVGKEVTAKVYTCHELIRMAGLCEDLSKRNS